MSTVHKSLSYVVGSSGPDANIWWLDPATNDPVSFTGWTLTAEVFDRGGTSQFSPATVTAQAGTGNGRTSSDVPNVLIEWAAAGELSTLTAGRYTLVVSATNDVDSIVRKREITLNIT